MIRIRATAPTRIDLAGGTLDLWPIHHLLDHKATVNVGVTLDAEVQLATRDDNSFEFTSVDQNIRFLGPRDDLHKNQSLSLLALLVDGLWPQEGPGLTISTKAKSPAGAGLGGSSCLGVALGAAVYKARQLWEKKTGRITSPDLTDHELVRLVQDAEARLIRTPTGCQDYWGGLRGRVNVITFPFGRTDVDTLPSSTVRGLDEQLILCYSGKSRASAINNWEIFKKLFDGDKVLLSVFQDIGKVSLECAEALREGLLNDALLLSKREWLLRTNLWPAIETTETLHLDRTAKEAGASFSRVCGAGGGGVMAVFCPPEKRSKVVGSLSEAGGTVLDAGVAEQGLTIDSDWAHSPVSIKLF
jgi:D-glycero-alpha-D-manno-heptose-7-phosphate kinase